MFFLPLLCTCNVRNERCAYGKCPKILYTKVSDKMAYTDSADPDQTAPEGADWSGSTLFAVPLSILRTNCIKRKI